MPAIGFHLINERLCMSKHEISVKLIYREKLKIIAGTQERKIQIKKKIIISIIVK